MARAIGWQERLDRTGCLTIPSGEHFPLLPLFLGDGADVRADQGSLVDTRRGAGIAFVCGWSRGLVTEDHFPGQYRTRGDTYLTARGTPWDLGPEEGWAAVQRLKIDFWAILHAGDWRHTRLAGVQGPRNGNSGPCPSPWVLYWDDECLTLGLGTRDGKYRFIRFPSVPYNVSPLELTVAVDLVGGVATCVKSGHLVDSDYADAGSDWGPGMVLADNYLWPFSAGRIDPFVSSSGYWGTESWPDMTIQSLSAEYYTPKFPGGWAVRGNPASAHVPYTGADVLPLYRTTDSEQRPVWFMVAQRNQALSNSSGEILLRDVSVMGTWGNPCITTGFVQGGLLIDHCRTYGGTRGVSCTGAGVCYPVKIQNSLITENSDCNLFLYKAGWLTVDDCQLRYSRRRVAVLVGCGGEGSSLFRNTMIAPGQVSHEYIIEQHGGIAAYHGLVANYEYEPGPRAIVRLHPETWDQGYFPSGVRMDDCCVGSFPGHRGAQVYVTARQPGYTGPVSIRVVRTDPDDPGAEGPGLDGIIPITPGLVPARVMVW
jgi:hypothetical protein